MKNRAEFISSVTIVGLAIFLVILTPNRMGLTQMVLVTTGSTTPEWLYVLWGDEYQKVHPETQLRYLPAGTSESAKAVLSGAGDLGGGYAQTPKTS